MLKQIAETVALNLRSIPQRLGLSLVIVVGIAGVVGVFTALFAMSRGIEATFEASGDARNAIVMRGGSQAELNSTVNRETLQVAERTPGLRRAANGEPLASGELIVIAELPRKGGTLGANVTLRGITPHGFELRPDLKIVEGRRFSPGLLELTVGRGAANQFEGLEVGRTVRLRSADWTVVGIFESGDAFESEIFTDAATAQTAWGRPNTFSTVLVGLESPESLESFEAALKVDPRVNVEAKRQNDYYAEQTRETTRAIRFLGLVVATIMGIGAVFAALNTMYAAVSARTREIATLRAIGFRAIPVVTSVLIEAMLLALVGGLIGALLAYVLFNGMTVSTLGSGFTQLVFAFKVTPGLVRDGVLIALAIGFLGGLFPAVRAARLPVTTALRAG
ncbi:MAG TPA: ABC transporter permease [Candidatus Saccharimonadia bacterium]|nr:ABC transporter permease [Candidatus Saccharimonadia bacterium]